MELGKSRNELIELYWGQRDKDVVQEQTRRPMSAYVRPDLCDDVIRQAALSIARLGPLCHSNSERIEYGLS